MEYHKAKDYIIARLVKELKPELTYHNIDHTIDVMRSVCRIAEGEGYHSNELVLMQTAALYHDSGMLVSYKGHERESVKIAREVLPGWEYTESDIERISKMILTTEMHQSASTPQEQILCDADLDYLGREDFFWIAQSLRLEWNTLNIRKTTLREWYEFQIEFMEGHTYFTETARQLRNAGKENNLQQIKELLSKS